MQYAKKKFGQNFISDKNLINKIINILDQDHDQLVIEIGPGKGALTKELVNRFKKVIAIEIDLDMEAVLKSEIKNTNFELIIEDCLKIDFSSLIKKNNFKKVSIISNLPYYITSEILFKTLSVSALLYKSVFMVQKEVAQRICAKINEKNYNNLSIAASLFSKVNYEFTVNKNNFKPIPKVDSAIISLTFNNDYLSKVKNVDNFLIFLRKIFNNKRKTILNNLNNLILDKEKALNILTFLNINPSLRPENIDIDQYINMFNEVN